MLEMTDVIIQNDANFLVHTTLYDSGHCIPVPWNSITGIVELVPGTVVPREFFWIFFFFFFIPHKPHEDLSRDSSRFWHPPTSLVWELKVHQKPKKKFTDTPRINLDFLSPSPSRTRPVKRCWNRFVVFLIIIFLGGNKEQATSNAKKKHNKKKGTLSHRGKPKPKGT